MLVGRDQECPRGYETITEPGIPIPLPSVEADVILVGLYSVFGQDTLRRHAVVVDHLSGAEGDFDISDPGRLVLPGTKGETLA
jgi:hypothetical protein